MTVNELRQSWNQVLVYYKFSVITCEYIQQLNVDSRKRVLFCAVQLGVWARGQTTPRHIWLAYYEMLNMTYSYEHLTNNRFP
jgi:hypothetical protein